MKKIGQIMCVTFVILLTASCSSEMSDETSAREYVDTVEIIKHPALPISEEYTVSSETSTATFVSFTEAECSISSEIEKTDEIDIFSLNFVEIDLNYDGIPEDFFLLDGSYEIVLYNTYNGMDYHSFTLPRVDNIDIYRRSVDYPSNYTYGFSCVYGKNKSVLFDMVYTGCETCRFIGGTGYEQDLTPHISYHEHFGSMSQGDFNKLMSDPHYFLKECREPEWEYVQTLNLEEIVNSGCTQRYLQSIRINDEVGEIQMFALENDIFGKEIKLMNENYSVYVSDFDSIEIYERTATMEIPTESYHVYDYTPRDDRDYLICLKSSVSGSTECVYLGTAEEKYLFLYNFNCVDGFSVEDTESLQKEGWQYVCYQDIGV